MRQFACACGAPVYFENDFCISCNSALGYDLDRNDMLTLADWGDGVYRDVLGHEYRYCGNAEEHRVCNWLLPADSPHALCFACRFNRTVPNQQQAGNQRRWLILERAKKRLVYTLSQLNLPLINGWDDPQRGLLLDFIEDGRSSDAFPETFVTTGYLGGVITINTLEADEVARTAAAEELYELAMEGVGYYQRYYR